MLNKLDLVSKFIRRPSRRLPLPFTISRHPLAISRHLLTSTNLTLSRSSVIFNDLRRRSSFILCDLFLIFNHDLLSSHDLLIPFARSSVYSPISHYFDDDKFDGSAFSSKDRDPSHSFFPDDAISKHSDEFYHPHHNAVHIHVKKKVFTPTLNGISKPRAPGIRHCIIAGTNASFPPAETRCFLS